MKLNEVFSEPSLFKVLKTLYPTLYPWAGEEVDFDYLYNHSGDKTVSPLIDKLVSNQGQAPLENAAIERICKILNARFGTTWQKLYTILSIEYNPIENYSMKEIETPDLVRTETPNITRETDRNQQTDLTVTTNDTNSDDTYGFNSNSPVPQDTSSGDTTERTQGNADNNKVHETNTEKGIRTHTETGKRELTRSGNIGVTTSQQMIQSEIDLWKWNFFETVYADCDKILTCPVYEQ